MFQRTYVLPDKVVEVKLPSGFSDSFLRELEEVLPQADESFKARYLREEIFSKYCDPKTTPPATRKSNAIEKWQGCERRNATTNSRLFLADEHFGWSSYARILSVSRKIISSILGPVRYPDILMDVLHTNGASTRVKRSEKAALLKLEGVAHISSSALKHWFRIASCTRLSSQTLTLQENSVLFTVPKKSDIDRVACKEPEINMLMQRSVGQFIAQRLRKVGIDLSDQTINQKLAAVAVSQGLATIDLSSASDSITNQLVFSMLPFDWYSLLDDLRVKSTLVDDTPHELEMFSSMGNGFTFELESLLFYAITCAVCKISRVPGRISVYGDDIIAPCAIVPRLIRVFHFIGFKTNAKKTFWTGTFRESCGKHYNRGLDVSPFFIRREVSTLPDLIKALNQLAEWAGRGWGFIEDPLIVDFHWKYSQFIPPYLWGGVEPMDNTCLVTGNAPRFRLTSKKRRVPRNEDSALTYWFMAKENTNNSISVEPSKDISYKATRCSRGWLSEWKPWFIRT